MRLRFSVCVVAGWLTAGPALALEGDPAAGQFIHVGGAGPETACFLCHDLAGQGDAAAGYPRLAGQSAYYLYKQLKDYAAGTRPNPTMARIAKTLTEKQMRDVAVWFSQIRGGAAAAPSPLPENVQPGQRLAIAGDARRQLPPCDSCHGTGGIGSFPAIPYLAGQNAPYLSEQLFQWQLGARNNDPLDMMSYVAKTLSTEEVGALARYYASLPPPRRQSQASLRQNHPAGLDQMHDQQQRGGAGNGDAAVAKGGNH